MKAYDIVKAYGHPNIRGTHRTTFEITREEELTIRGDCIIGVRADKSAKTLSSELKNILRRRDSILVVVLEANGFKDIVVAQGDERIIAEDKVRIIVRKSTYIEPATIGVRANKSARDLDRRLIDSLKDPDMVLYVKFIALTLDEVDPIDIGVGGII